MIERSEDLPALTPGEIVSGESRRSKEAFLERSARAATGLKQLGIGAGDTVALFLRNDIAFLEASAATGLLGAYPVAMNWHSTAAEAEYVLEDCGARVFVIHEDLLALVMEGIPEQAIVIMVETPPEILAAYGGHALSARPPVRPVLRWNEWLERHAPHKATSVAAPGAMIYTSGTTGRPKGVQRLAPTPAQAAAAERLVMLTYGLDGASSDAVSLVTAPMYHSAPNAVAMRSLRAGAGIILQPKFDAEDTLRLIEHWRVTHAYFAPIMFNRLLQLPEAVRRRYDLSSLRFVVHAAAPCAPEVKRAMIAWWGPVINEFYGSTEARAVSFGTSAEWLAHPGTVGRLLPGAVVRIVDEDGQDLPAGQAGEIICNHPACVDFTYYNDDAKRRAGDRGGLFATGDIGYLNNEGYLFICDRSSDMIISGGVNIYPAEVEAELMRIPGVADCAVFGIPDPEYGEAVMAVIQAMDGQLLDPDAILASLRGRLAGFKMPRRIEQMAELPREDSGKILKRKLRDSYWSNELRRI